MRQNLQVETPNSTLCVISRILDTLIEQTHNKADDVLYSKEQSEFYIRKTKSVKLQRTEVFKTREIDLLRCVFQRQKCLSSAAPLRGLTHDSDV